LGIVKVRIERLCLEKEQLDTLQNYYAEGNTVAVHSFDEDNEEDQLQAQRLLHALGLDQDQCAQLERKWSIAWSTSWDLGGKKDAAVNKDEREKNYRSLYQCVCGYSHLARQTRDRASKAQNQSKPYDKASDEAIAKLGRRVAYNFTGCLAHVDVTRNSVTNAISRITGFLEHNELCISATLQRVPAIPLHPQVYEIALAQLRVGAEIGAIKSHNASMIEKRAYEGISVGPVVYKHNVQCERLIE